MQPFFDPHPRFLFECEDCGMILSVELEEAEDVEKLHQNELVLECPCGGKLLSLKD